RGRAHDERLRALEVRRLVGAASHLDAGDAKGVGHGQRIALAGALLSTARGPPGAAEPGLPPALGWADGLADRQRRVLRRDRLARDVAHRARVVARARAARDVARDADDAPRRRSARRPLRAATADDRVRPR